MVFHASLNPDPKDNLSDEELSEIAQSYMQKLGYGKQAFVVFKHSDIQRAHLHIVSLRIDESGKKINDSYEVRRSMKICKELEQEFGLTPLVKAQRVDEAPTQKIDYVAGDIKHQVGNISKSLLNHFYFQSFGEYRTLLEMFNVRGEEVKGEYKDKPYNGVIYSVIDDKGKKVGVPFKSSLFGKSVGFDALQKHFQVSKLAIGKNKVREDLRPIIALAMKTSPDMEHFKLLLQKQNISAVFRINEAGRIYGVSFIDYQNNTILNGSRLGKEFSANVFNELFKDVKSVELNRPKVEANHSSQLTESVENQQSINSDNLSLLSFEQHGADYEAENFAREKETEEKIRQRKRRKGRGI